MVISANDLKVKGISLLDGMFKTLDEVLVSVRGKNKYVIVDMERYTFLRECELEHALRETKEDIAKGHYKTVSVEEHFKALDDALQD
jgi:hypothetical protein